MHMRSGMSHAEAGKLGYLRALKRGNIIWRIQHEVAKEKYSKNPKFCPNCKKRLSYEGRFWKFCSHSCAASFNNRRREVKKRLCLICGKITNKYGSGRYAKHCVSCVKSGVVYFKKLENIKTDGGRKSWLLRNRGHRCETCLKTRWNGQSIPLDMHHVDGNSDNNADKNLELLCPNCHAQTKTYKNKKRDNTSRNIKRRRKYASFDGPVAQW